MPRNSSPCNNTAIREATRRLGQIYDTAFRPSGLRATQYTILSRVRARPGVTMRELADWLVMDLSALGHTLKPLVRDGFLKLVMSERDRRAKIIRLTEAGEAKFAEATHHWRTVQTTFETAYGVEAAAQLRQTLAHLASDEFQQAFELASDRVGSA